MQNSTEIQQMELQTHLAEYSALRDEILQLIKWRDSLVFISLGISGALFSFTFSKDTSLVALTNQWTPLYLVTPLASLVGGLWVVDTWRINRLGMYITEILTTRIQAILNSQKTNENIYKDRTVFEWQTSFHRMMYHKERRLLSWYVYISTFVISGVTAQLLLIGNLKGSIKERILASQFPPFYIINWIILLFFTAAFMMYLIKGMNEKNKGVIWKV